MVEEAPSAVLTPELREAVDVAPSGWPKAVITWSRHCRVFARRPDALLLGNEHAPQVEHPVTEHCQRGLGREQIRIAEGTSSFSQNDLSIRGHAIETACTPKMPGRDCSRYGNPAHYASGGPGVRVDDGVEEGQKFDSLRPHAIVSGARAEPGSGH